MRPSAAEVARTLARGPLRGSLRIALGTRLKDVQHAGDSSGRPLVLAKDGSPLAAALPLPGAPGPTALLYVQDVPPVDGAPSLGAVRIAGRLRRLSEAEVAAAKLEFADANPANDLLDVGHGATIGRLEVERVQLEPSDWLVHDAGLHRPIHDLDLDAYRTAPADPLHAIERDLLLDLSDHHTAQIESYLRCALSAAGLACVAAPRTVRVDRYGFTAATGAPESSPPDRRWVRVAFARPVRDHRDLAALLHPLLFHSRPT
ncbi:hypothetical protein [Flindersiella endophytica]